MGTRGLTCVIVDQEFKIAQYGQWDHYPSGAGVKILQFLKDIIDSGRLEEFANKVRQLRTATDDQVEATWKACRAADADFVAMDIAKLHDNRYPEFSRNTGCDILDLVMHGEFRKRTLKGEESVRKIVYAVHLRSQFAGDGLFCEYAYVIDLDSQKLEVYEGLKEAGVEISGRFKHVEKFREDYEPVSLVRTFDFDSLPSEDEFLSLLESEEAAE